MLALVFLVLRKGRDIVGIQFNHRIGKRDIFQALRVVYAQIRGIQTQQCHANAVALRAFNGVGNVVVA